MGSFDETQIEPVNPLRIRKDIHGSHPSTPDDEGSNRKKFAAPSRKDPDRSVDPHQLCRQPSPAKFIAWRAIASAPSTLPDPAGPTSDLNTASGARTWINRSKSPPRAASRKAATTLR